MTLNRSRRRPDFGQWWPWVLASLVFVIFAVPLFRISGASPDTQPSPWGPWAASGFVFIAVVLLGRLGNTRKRRQGGSVAALLLALASVFLWWLPSLLGASSHIGIACAWASIAALSASVFFIGKLQARQAVVLAVASEASHQ